MRAFQRGAVGLWAHRVPLENRSNVPKNGHFFSLRGAKNHMFKKSPRAPVQGTPEPLSHGCPDCGFSLVCAPVLVLSIIKQPTFADTVLPQVVLFFFF